MAMPRLQPNTLRSVLPRPPIHPQIRCLRTRPNRPSPRQSAFGFPTISEVHDAVTKRMKKTSDEPKIPLVPKFGEDNRPIKERRLEAMMAARKKSLEEISAAEAVELEKQKESEERLAQFERDREANKGKTEQEILRQGFDEQVGELNQGVEETDNKVYPRDVIGRKFKKEKVKYKIDMYAVWRLC